MKPWRRVRPGENVPTLRLPEEYAQPGTLDDNTYEDETPDRPKYWTSGDGTVEMPYYIIANAKDVKLRIGADELRDMAREMHADALKNGLKAKQEENRAQWNAALLKSFETSKQPFLNQLAKRLKFG
jgi:hypothetical protein